MAIRNSLQRYGLCKWPFSILVQWNLVGLNGKSDGDFNRFCDAMLVSGHLPSRLASHSNPHLERDRECVTLVTLFFQTLKIPYTSTGIVELNSNPISSLLFPGLHGFGLIVVDGPRDDSTARDCTLATFPDSHGWAHR
jgi:hypothetical protein